jgi:hypothetical protein
MAEGKAYQADPVHTTASFATAAITSTYGLIEHVYDGRAYPQYQTDEWNLLRH